MKELVLGVDFGSSTTISGVLIGDRIELVQEQGDPSLPSVAYVPERGPPEVGRRALLRQLTDPTRVIRSVKRILGLPPDAELVRHYAANAPFRVDHLGAHTVLRLRGGDIAPEQVAGWILTRVRELAEARFGATIRRAVVTMSAAAPAGYRDAIRRAARLAHLEIVELVSEPIAGALAVDLHARACDRNLVVCDFGGGTFDVSAVVQRGLAFSPIATGGDSYLGGDDLDDAMAEAIAGLIYRSSRYDMHKDIVRWNELLARCESAKRVLSSAPTAPLSIREAYVEGGRPRDLHVTVDHPWVEGVWAPLFQRVQAVVLELLARARWSVGDVDTVALVGGSSVVPAFRRALAELFGRSKLVSADAAELAVARGAILLTSRHRREPKSDSIPILLDM